jgi:hypothetical protein
MRTKVFVIGLQKTGTTSMAGALGLLGYHLFPARLKDKWKRIEDMTLERLHSIAVPQIDRYDAFVNLPWPLFYQDLAQTCPDAKFILTVRDTEKWLSSARKHFVGRFERPFDRFAYGGMFFGNETMYRQRYEEHNAGVQAYFATQPDRLLTIDITQNPGWGKICQFLGRTAPDIEFPHTNKTGSLRAQWRGIENTLMRRVEAVKTYFSPPEI